jgi:GNAT superfamily N-acetyltransferase
MPLTIEDPPNAGQPVGEAQAAAEAATLEVVERVRATVLPRLVREAEDRGWWRPGDTPAPRTSRAAAGPGEPVVRPLAAIDLDALALAARTIAPFYPAAAHALLAAAAADGARVVGAIAGSTLVGVAVAAPAGPAGPRPTEALLAVGVAPGHRRRGLGGALLRSLAEGRTAGTAMTATIGVAERDVVEPLDVETRRDVARRLLASAGFEPRAVSPDVARDDPWAVAAGSRR